MNELQQIVIQITSSSEVRAIAQYGSNLVPDSQELVKYATLSPSEKLIWDDFVAMIHSKKVQ